MSQLLAVLLGAALSCSGTAAAKATLLSRVAHSDVKPRKSLHAGNAAEKRPHASSAGRTLLTLDANKDGVVDPKEVADFAKAQGLDAAAVTKEFMQIDANGDGRLDAEEIQRALHAGEVAGAPQEVAPSATHSKRHHSNTPHKEKTAPHKDASAHKETGAHKEARLHAAAEAEKLRLDREAQELDKKRKADEERIDAARKELVKQQELFAKRKADEEAAKLELMRQQALEEATRKAAVEAKEVQEAKEAKEEEEDMMADKKALQRSRPSAASVRERLAAMAAEKTAATAATEKAETNEDDALEVLDTTAENEMEEVQSAEGSMSALLSKEEAWEAEAQLLEQHASELRLNASLLAKSTARLAVEAGARAARAKSKVLLRALDKLESGAKKAEVTAAALHAKSEAEVLEADDLIAAADSALARA